MLIEHAGTLVTLEGAAVTALLPRLLPLLDGTRTTDELVVALGPAVAPAVENALTLLAENRLLVDGPSPDVDGHASSAGAYAAALTRSTTPAAAVDALETAPRQPSSAREPARRELARQLAIRGLSAGSSRSRSTPSRRTARSSSPRPSHDDGRTPARERSGARVRRPVAAGPPLRRPVRRRRPDLRARRLRVPSVLRRPGVRRPRATTRTSTLVERDPAAGAVPCPPRRRSPPRWRRCSSFAG